MTVTASFRNNMAIVAWVFMAIWDLGLLLMTWAFIRDGGFHQFNPLVEHGILGLFWIFGAMGTAACFGRSRVHVAVDNGEITVRERWLLGSRIERFPVGSAGLPRVVQQRDSDGDPYFQCIFTTPVGRDIIVKESHSFQDADIERDRLAAAIAKD
ncbi:MAG: hypothetical protein AB7F76_08435 [Parvibaculaceae bacterium]